MGETILIRGGQVIDGTGAPARRADVLIKWGLIADVGDFPEAEADLVLEAQGKVVCPGFIDTHVQSDLQLLAQPQHISALSQGVTTEILGQDGLSYAPLSPDNLREYRKYLAGLNGNPQLDQEWSSVAQFRRLFDKRTAINVAYQVPHGPLRLETVGFADGPLQGENLRRAQKLLAQGFEEGAVGFSTGLSYYPCSFADTEELVELCKVAALYNRPFVIHLRTVFPIQPGPLMRWRKPLKSQVRCFLHFSHFKTGTLNPGRAAELMAPIDAAQERGVDITLECYPYPAGAGFALYMMPRWANVGGYGALMARLADPHLRRRIMSDMRGLGLLHEGIITYVAQERHREFIGRTFREVAEDLGLDEAEFICQLLLENNLAVGHMQPPPEEPLWEQLDRDLMELLLRPNYMVGSDALSAAVHPHPRTYGTFTRFLRLQREHKFMPLEALIQGMTSVPARRFGLKDRGELKRGKAADVVVFDPLTVGERATYERPKQLSEGILYVLVNGTVAFSHGKALGVLAGRALP